MKLEIKNISYAYEKKGKKIISDFNLDLEGDERVGLIAPSGYGKTTLCKILSGYIKPDEGNVFCDGVPSISYYNKLFSDSNDLAAAGICR